MVLKCKNCGRENHPIYDRKYRGYCLDCWNAKADAKDESIRELEAQVAALRADKERLDRALESWESCDKFRLAAIEMNLRAAIDAARKGSAT